MRILLENGADVNLPTDVCCFKNFAIPTSIMALQNDMQDEFGDTPLIEACDGGYVAIVALLIDKGARIDYKN